MRKIVAFLKKNWKIVAVIIGVLLLSGILRRIITKVTLIFGSFGKGISPSSESSKDLIDYDFLAMTIYDDLKLQWFDFSRHNEAVKGIINSFSNTNQFLELCRRYALKYNEDLRSELKKHFTDKNYGELLWK